MKKLICSALALGLLTMTACNTISLPETEETIPASVTNSAEQSAAYPIAFTSKDTAEFDLDGDGKTDTITFATGDVDKYSPSKLTVNGKEYDAIEITPDNFWICDIDSSDNQLEIAVSTYGMSDDYATEFYRLKDGNLISIGFIEDMIDGNYESDIYMSTMAKKSAIFNGDGTITAAIRLDVFQTWFSYTTYTYDKETDKISENGTMYYPYGEENADNYKAAFDMIFSEIPEDERVIPTTNREIYLYTDMDKSSEAIAFAPQHFMATATDNENWVYLVGEDGTKGWLYLENDWSTAVDAKSGESYEYNDIMEKLFLYD